MVYTARLSYDCGLYFQFAYISIFHKVGCLYLFINSFYLFLSRISLLYELTVAQLSQLSFLHIDDLFGHSLGNLPRFTDAY